MILSCAWRLIGLVAAVFFYELDGLECAAQFKKGLRFPVESVETANETRGEMLFSVDNSERAVAIGQSRPAKELRGSERQRLQWRREPPGSGNVLRRIWRLAKGPESF